MSESDDRYQRVNIRLPRELHGRLQGVADRLSRSMNAEIIARLEASFTPVEERLSAVEVGVGFESARADQIEGRIQILENRVRAAERALSLSLTKRT